MRAFLIFSLALQGLVQASPSCSSFTDCYGCAQGCNWCHRDNQCHDSGFVHLVDPCWIHEDDTSEWDKCAVQPVSKPDEWTWNHCAYEWGSDNKCTCSGEARFGRNAKWTDPKVVDGTFTCDKEAFGGSDPYWFHAKECECRQSANPATPATNNTFAKGVLQFLLTRLKITDVKLDDCISDVGSSELRFRDFAVELKHKKYTSAFHDLGRGISALANSVTTCGVKEVQQKVDAFASAVKWANISTSGFDKDVKALVGAKDMWVDLEALATAVDSKDPNSVGDTLNKLLDDWTSIESGCQAGQTVCQVVDGLLRVLATTAKEVEPCEAALTPAVGEFSQGAQLFKAKDYKQAIAKFAAGLDVMAKATTSDACGLKNIADAIGKLSPKLAAAVVKVESSSEVQILIGSADIYDELFVMAQDFEKKDYTGVGVQLGMLLAKLKASGCQTPMCIVVEGILGSLQVGFTDLEACSSNLDTTWTQMQSLLSSLENKQWTQSLLALGNVLKDLGDDVKACGVPALGSILQGTASQLHDDSLASDIGLAMRFLVKGADITPDIQKIIVDSTNKSWGALGSDLGTLSTWITSTGCHSFACKLMEGILEEAGMALTDLKPCEDKVRAAEKDFTTGATLWGHKEHKSALNYWSAGLSALSQAVDACGLPKQLKYIQQEANLLGLGNISSIGDAVSVLVHGADLAEELSEAWTDFAKQDYRGAGAAFQKAVSNMYKWTTGHLCTNPACYVFSGVLQYMSDLAKDLKKCEHDLGDMMAQFSAAFHQFSSKGAHKGFTKNMTAIKVGIGDIGKGFGDLANSVGDCHLADLAAILTELAAKLGTNPAVELVEEILKILIGGVAIEREISSALTDFGADNWPGFGYNLIKLIKTLVESKAVQASVDTWPQNASAIVI